MRRSASRGLVFAGWSALSAALGACTTPYADWEPRVPDTAPEARGTWTAPGAAAGAVAPAGLGAGTEEPLAAPDREGGAARSPAAEPSELPPLTLEQAVDMALARSRGIQVADRRILMAQDRLDEAYTLLIPRVVAEGRAQARSNDVGGRFGDQSFTIGDKYVGSARVGLLVPVYTFGLVSSKAESEELSGKAAQHDAERTRQDVVFAVSQAYFRILEAQKILAVVEDSILVVRRQKEIAEDFLEEGIVARNDVLSAEVQLANREQQRIQAENNLQLAVATFNRLLRLDVSRRTRVVDALEVEPWRGSFAQVVEVALRDRPDLKALAEQVGVARAEYEVTQAMNRPYVYGFGNYQYSSDSFLLNDDWVEGGLVLTVPIFDGLETHTKLKRKKREIEEAIDVHDDRVDDVVLTVKRAWLAVGEAARRIPVARKSIDEAQENLRITRDQYGQGWVSSTDVLTEEERLSRARSNYYEALYAYHAAYAALAHEIGGEPPSPFVASPEPGDSRGSHAEKS